MERNEAALQPSELPHGGRLCPSRETRVLEGDRSEKEKGQKEKGKGVAGKKKSTKQALGRYSKAKNVLKTTC